MTIISTPTKINGSGNVDFTCPFDVIFPLITTAINATYALAGHPTLECWTNTALDSITAGTGDSKVFWTTDPTYKIGATLFLGSMLRAIPTHVGEGSSGVGWALNANQEGGTAYPTSGKGRCLRGGTDVMPLLPNASNFLGANNTDQFNRIPFNLAAAIHSATSATPGDLTHYLAVRYAFVMSDPTMSVRGNTNQSGEPSSFGGVPNINHPHMLSIFGDDASPAKALEYGQAGSNPSLPYMTLPGPGLYKYSDYISAVAP